MTITVRLDASTEACLLRLARRKGLSKSELVREAVHILAQEEESRAARRPRPYEAIAHLIGSVRGGPPNLSERTGVRLREHLAKRSPRR